MKIGHYAAIATTALALSIGAASADLLPVVQLQQLATTLGQLPEPFRAIPPGAAPALAGRLPRPVELPPNRIV